MAVLALATPAWIFISALLLFGMLVVVRSTFDLVRESKSLARKLRSASERLNTSLGEVRHEAERASERLTRTRGGSRRRR